MLPPSLHRLRAISAWHRLRDDLLTLGSAPSPAAIADHNLAAATRAVEAMMEMAKIDIAAIEAAWHG